MMMIVVLVILAGTGFVLFAALWPPPWAPHSWRTWTRPLRHSVRRRHYRSDRWFF